MPDDDKVISTMTFGDREISIIESDGGDPIRVLSHQPFSNDYTCAVRKDILQALHRHGTLAAFITILNAAMQLLVTTETK